MALEETTIRDFGGGWNVSDSDKSLSSRYQPVSDNVVRGTDGHFNVRQGHALFTRLRNGVETIVAAASYTVTTVNGTAVVKITQNSHGYTSGNHVTISGFSADLNGITQQMMNQTHGIFVNDANNFSIVVRGAATSSGTGSRSFSYVRDTHILSGRTIFGRYYKENIIVFSENGEIAAVNSSGVATRIWDYTIATGLTVPPWSYCRRVSAEIIRGRLIAVNGAVNDKPIAIDGVAVNYLVDASSLSNNAIPRAEFVIAANQYVILVNTEYGPTKLEIGAKNTVMTCSREADPDDAVEIDVGMMTQTIDSTILGASVARSRVFLGFADRTMLGTLGIYTTVDTTSIHEPDFSDNIAEFGTFAHSSIISLGNDLFCAGMNGINSLEISKSSGEFVPSTVSDLIHPVMLRHFARLTDDDRQYRVFAVFDNTTRSYMLFAPKYSEMAILMEPDPIYVTSTLQKNSLVYLRYPGHALDAGDYVVIAGAVDASATLLASMINGKRRIRHVVDEDTLVIETDPYSPNVNVAYGGSAVTVTPVNDETVGYVYEYNTRLKIRRWTRFRDLDFDWGTRSQLNTLFFGKNGDIWQMGNPSSPISADKVGDYDFAAFANAQAYAVGDRVKDANGLVYECLIDHTSDASGTFLAERTAHISSWQEFRGYPITWALDSSWTDFKHRIENKEVELVRFDTKGRAAFTFSLFTNSIYNNFESFELAPARSTDFVAEDSPGFGGGDQPFGGGRNTAQEWLHSMPCSGKLFRLRFSGSSTYPLQINAVTLYYRKSKGVLT